MSLLAGAAVAAVLELDAVHAGQLLVSRPLVMGPVVGAVSGELGTGLLAGVTFELLGLAQVPVGGSLSWSAPVGAAVAALVGAKGGLAWMPAGILAGWLHARFEAFERRRRVGFADALETAARAGEAPAYGRYLAACGAAHAAATFALVYAAQALLAPPLPEAMRESAVWASMAAPLLSLIWLSIWGLRRA